MIEPEIMNKQQILLYNKIMDILNITEKNSVDESIEKYGFHKFTPIVGTNLNNPD